MRNLRAVIVFFWLLASVGAQTSENVTAKVVKVVDGDTFAVKDTAGRRRQVSLPGLDAPELLQKRGPEARKNLEKLIGDKTITLVYTTKRTRPAVSKVLSGNLDVGLEQLKAGWAWRIPGSASKLTPEDHELYKKAETAASTAKLGLWQDAEPIPPATFRKTAKEQAFGPLPAADKQIIGNKLTKKYHLPHCSGYKGVTLKNRVLFATAAEAEEKGYVLAGNCGGKKQPVAPVANNATTVKEATTVNEATAIVGNKATRIYHHLGCPGYSRVSAPNRVNFLSAEDAEKAGYRRAKNCH